jgi:hypothetical protein
LRLSSCCLASNAPHHSQKRRKILVLQAVLQHGWPVSSYLHKSGELGFLTIAHLLEFVVSPTMYCLFPPQREISLQFLNVSGRECHCLIDEASALHHACFLLVMRLQSRSISELSSG